jgi:hypothetical protein
MTSTVTQAATVEELSEHAIALSVEAFKAHRAGAHTAPVVQMPFGAIAAAHRAGGSITTICREADLRYAAHLINIHTLPGYEETAALDGDLDHPENTRGEKTGLAGATR